MDSIPHSTFSTDLVPKNERFSFWKESISVLFDVSLPKESNDQFEARIDAYMLDELLLAKSTSVESTFERLQKNIQSDGIDMIMLHLRIKGESETNTKNNITHGQVGDLGISDLGQHIKHHTSNYECISLCFPREVLEEFIPNISLWHGRILPRDSPMTQLLRSHILSLYQVCPHLSVDACASIQRSTLELIHAALSPTSTPLSNCPEAVSHTILLEIKRFIRKQLTNPELSPELICTAFNLSRPHLYRITKPLNGITRYIRSLRLKHCLKDLQNPLFRHISITELGFKWGFNDAGTFTRNFKRYFGFTPRDAREHTSLTVQKKDLPTSETIETGRLYEEWIRSLST